MLSVLRRRPGRRSIAALVSISLLSLLVAGVTAASAADNPTATVTGPICGADAAITLTNPTSRTVRFTVARGTGATVVDDVWVYATRSTTLRIPVVAGNTGERLTVRTGTSTLATVAVKRATASCAPGVAQVPALQAGFSAAIGTPACGAEVPVVLNNGRSGVVWLEVHTKGLGYPEAVHSVAGGQVLSTTATLRGASQTLQVIWNGAAIAERTVSTARPCSPTTTTTRATTTTSSTTTTSTTTPSTTTSTSTSTTSTTSTAVLPVCTAADRLAAWGGCPVRVDQFTGTQLSTATVGWNPYDFPNDTVRKRVKENVRVANGELQLMGTYDQNERITRGSGIADHFNQLYGRWEVRMRADRGAGFSAVSLLWPDQGGKWPDDGEIDIYEIPKPERARAMHVAHNGPTNSSQGKWSDVDATQWHVYAMEWTPTSIRFLIDGVEKFVVTNPKLVPKTWPMHMTLQMDPGCDSWYQCPNSTTPPVMSMYVDYIKIWDYPG